MAKYNPSVAFFKAYKGQGAAFTIGLGKDTFFFTLFPEVSERKFDTTQKITVAMGQPDIGEVLAVINGRKQGLGTIKEGKFTGLYHEVKGKSVTSIHLFKKEDSDSYLFGLSKKVGGESKRFSVNLTPGDLEIIRCFINRYIDILFEQNTETQANNPHVSDSVPDKDVPF